MDAPAARGWSQPKECRYDSRRLRSADLPSDSMRFRSVVMFGRLIGAIGLGAYLGAGVAGLVALVTGQVVHAGGSWSTGVAVLGVLGASVGALLARLTRNWLACRLPRRMLWLTAAGAVLLPVASSVGQLRSGTAVVLLFMATGSLVTLVLWTRALRRSRSTPASRSVPGSELRYRPAAGPRG